LSGRSENEKSHAEQFFQRCSEIFMKKVEYEKRHGELGGRISKLEGKYSILIAMHTINLIAIIATLAAVLRK
jgi:hypothetical protein